MVSLYVCSSERVWSGSAEAASSSWSDSSPSSTKMSTGGRSERSVSVSIEEVLSLLAGTDDDLLGTCWGVGDGDAVPAWSASRSVEDLLFCELLVDLETVCKEPVKSEVCWSVSGLTDWSVTWLWEARSVPEASVPEAEPEGLMKGLSDKAELAGGECVGATLTRGKSWVWFIQSLG